MTSMAFSTKKIEDFCRTGSGGTPSRSKPEYFDGGTIPWVKSGELKTRFVSSTEESITDAAVEQSAAKLVPKGALLIAMYGATVGEVSELAVDATTNQAICHIVPDPNLCDRGYLYQYLTAIKPELLDRRVGGGQPNISQAIIKSLSVPLPPLPEQRRIAAILDKADALRAKRREGIAKLDQLLQSVFLEMFGDPVTNPKGWPIGKISDLLESAKYGSSEKADLQGEVPILRMNNITYSGEMNLTVLKYISRDKAEEKYSVMPGDILFNRTNSKELVGKTAVYEGPTPMAYAGYLVRARTADGHAPEYISAFMNSSYGKSTLQAMCKSIVGMANINAREFQAISIPIPPCELQQSFRSHVRAIRVRKRALELQSQKFDALFSSLQQ